MAEVALAAARADGRRLFSAKAGQQRQRFLIAPRLDGGNGSSFSASVASALNSRMAARASVEGELRRLVGLLLQRAVDERQHRLVMGLEDRLRSRDPLGGIGRQQGEAAERRVHGAAQTVVEAHSGGISGSLSTASPVAASMILSSGCCDIDLLGVGIGDSRPS